MESSSSHTFRKTSQPLLPLEKPEVSPGRYDLYPAFPAGENRLFTGFASLAGRLRNENLVMIDGYGGVFFADFVNNLVAALTDIGISVTTISVESALRDPPEIEALLEPFLGGNDPLFGTRCTLELSDLFCPERLAQMSSVPDSGLTIIFGSGAVLAPHNGIRWYIDLPKNEIQYRSRAGLIRNLGAAGSFSPKVMYKRFYFVDWVLLNRHKDRFAGLVDLVIDGQRPAEPVWMEGGAFRETLRRISESPFRVRPWFEPGTWGGRWIMEHIPELPQEVPNYAWSFELIVPENGLILESDGVMMEVSFDWLMFREAEAVLGNAFGRFGKEFPIRFDFLDTFAGGNLSIQVHPRKQYIMEHFGENFTQQEAYYILDSCGDAEVNLGFRDGIDAEEFRTAMEYSARHQTPADIPRYVQQHPARKHDLFLIPDGTIHGSGVNNLVLEISTTPYIFTFKIYDWLRPDLNGKPRDLNIRRAMENLCFDRQGDRVRKEFISVPSILSEGDGWSADKLPTHELHLYDVVRYRIANKVTISTFNRCHVLNLVEGSSVRVQTANTMEMQFSYAETFIIPAAAGHYTVVNEGATEAVLVIAFIKDDQ